jgi:hypothetical protein
VPRAAPGSGRDLAAAALRATIEGGAPQRVGTEVVLGDGGFADDTCPPDALVAVPDGRGGYAVGATLAEARRRAGKVQGRNIPGPLAHPVDVPAGRWDVTLRTTWVEPAYLETDASWCAPGAEPVSACANGGAFGGKQRSPASGAARRLADELGRPVRVLWSREDVVRLGPKRPPVGAGVDADGCGVLRVGVTAHEGDDPGAPDTAWNEAAWDGACGRATSVAPGLSIETVPVGGPRISLDLRAALWAEAAVLDAAVGTFGRRGVGGGRRADGPADEPVEVVAPSGGRAAVGWSPGGPVEVEVDAGRVLDEVVLRSYCIGAVHQALGWVLSEGIATDEHGEVRDLTVRSFGILPARAMPEVRVTVTSSPGPPVNGSDAVFAAAAAACWIGRGLSPAWPIERSGTRS